MLKPVRVLSSEIGDQFSQRLANDIANTMQFILAGFPVELTNFEAFCMPIETYLANYRKKSVLLKTDIEGNPDDNIYTFFELNTAITLGCLMRQMQDSMIRTKIDNQEYVGPIADAFGEIGNQFTGTLDRVLRNLSKTPLHLILDFKKRIYPDEAISIDQFNDSEEYIVWVSTITLQGYGKHKITLLMPQSLYERMIGYRVRLEGITPRKIVLWTWDPKFSQVLKEKIESRYFTVELATQPGDIVHLSKDPNCCAIAIDFNQIAFPLAHDMKILAKRLQMAKIPESIPMWISMGNPSHDICLEFENMGLRGATLADAKSNLEPWLQAQLKKVTVRE